MKTKPTVYKSILDPKSDEILEHVFRDRMEYLGIMSSAMVYKLQIPLIIMRGKVETYLRHPELSPKQTLVEFAKEFEALLKLLDSMVFVGPKTKKIRHEALPIRELIEKLMFIFDSNCVANAISYHVNIDPELKIYSEPNRLKHILLALITNAMDSFIDMDKEKPKNILFHTRCDAQGIHIIISDTGCGMSEEVQEKILTQAFFSTKTHHSASGLGLSLARKMASDLQIDMSFLSEAGQGTSFSLTFPINLYSLDSKSDSSSDSKAKL